MKKNDMGKYWIWLSNACGKGSKVAVNLVRRFNNAYGVFSASDDDLRGCEFRIDPRVMARITYKDCSEEEDIVRWCDESGVRILCPDDSDYPSDLKNLVDAPMVLFCVGKLPDWDETLMCAIVGTRAMSEYGSKMAYDFGFGIASGGGCIVSGLALGCDSQAIRGALDAGGKTVAILGCGIDVVYPKDNMDLYERIVKNGAIITEYSPGVSPVGNHFPVRNRIISGVSQAVCVIEGSIKSGSLITARHAFYQNRDLYAVPGRVGESGSEGTNFLLKNGAVAVTDPVEILEKFQFSYPHTIEIKKIEQPWVKLLDEEAEVKILPRKEKVKKKKKASKEPIFPEKPSVKPTVDFDSLGDEELKIYRSMTPDVPMLAEEICNVSGIPVASVMASLTLLEMTGVVESGAGGYFMRHADDEEVGEPAITEFDTGM
ncbi:MAG: DNA-processing protein DprA [Clostridia bacterium]|nr:DNA-processing protein DprA [Clostridia bacterium]